MKKSFKGLFTAMILVMMLSILTMPVLAAENVGPISETAAASDGASITEESEDGVLGDKAQAAAIVVGLAAAAGAIGMGIAIAKSTESIARQPEAEGKIRTTLMLGLVFIETAIIYALVVAILIIFVL